MPLAHFHRPEREKTVPDRNGGDGDRFRAHTADADAHRRPVPDHPDQFRQLILRTHGPDKDAVRIVPDPAPQPEQPGDANDERMKLIRRNHPCDPQQQVTFVDNGLHSFPAPPATAAGDTVGATLIPGLPRRPVAAIRSTISAQVFPINAHLGAGPGLELFMNPTPSHVLSPGLLALGASSAVAAVAAAPAAGPVGGRLSEFLVGAGDSVVLLAIGAAGALLGPRSRWGFPIMVVALRSFGIVLGAHGAVAPVSDLVVTPILCFVLLLLANVRLGVAMVATLAGAFALFHGLTDGHRITTAGPDAGAIAGYGMITILALLAGVAVGEWIRRHEAPWAEHVRHVLRQWHGIHLHH